MQQSNCQDARNQKEILEIDCPECGAKGSIEVFVKDGRTVETAICDACGFEIPEDTIIE